jgi:hypothetical protein
MHTTSYTEMEANFDQIYSKRKLYKARYQEDYLNFLKKQLEEIDGEIEKLESKKFI